MMVYSYLSQGPAKQGTPKGGKKDGHPFLDSAEKQLPLRTNATLPDTGYDRVHCYALFAPDAVAVQLCYIVCPGVVKATPGFFVP